MRGHFLRASLANAAGPTPTSVTWNLISNGVFTSDASLGDISPNVNFGASGDLMVAFVAWRGPETFSAPPGWTIHAQQNSGNTSTVAADSLGSVLIASIVRGASAPANTFTRSGGSVAQARVMAFRASVGTPTFVTAQSRTPPAGGTDQTLTGITTTGPTTLIIIAFGSISGANMQNFVAATDPTTGVTNTNNTATGVITADSWRRVINPLFATSPTNQLTVIIGIKTNAGATGNFSWTTASSATASPALAAFHSVV